MAVFAYKAIDRLSTPVSGTVVSDTPRHARDALRAQGLTIRFVAEQRPAPLQFWRRRSSRRRSARFVAFTRELSTLLSVGIPLTDAIDTILQSQRGSFRSTLLMLRERIAAGSGLAAAMREQPAVFDALSVNLVEVGENAGTLEAVLERLVEFKERSAAFKNRLGTALIYPAIVLVMALATSICLMTFVVPNLLAALTDAGRPLPWPTRVVKGASDLLVHRGWVLLPAGAIGVAAAALLLRTHRGRLLWHRALLGVPLLGDLARKQAVVRIAIVLSTLLKSGMVFVRALRIASDATPNLVLKAAMTRCEAAVVGGRDIGKALAATAAFPPLVVQIFSVGQESGRLEEMLDRLATDYDAQVQLASQRLTAILEPVLILGLVALVGLIGFATVLPLMEAADVM